MAVFRINKTNDFTSMSNQHLKNKNLSLKAKGLLSLMLALPDDWDYSVNGLISICKENETSIKSTLNELKNNGYLKVTKLMPNETCSKKFEYVYNIYEQSLENQGLENLCLENQDIENQVQLNTNILNTNKLNTKNNITPYSPPKKYDEDLFNRFWKEYPKKVSKGNAEKWFVKNKPSEELVNKMISKINILKQTEQWERNNGQFIPYPATWLNAKGWEDEVTSQNNLQDAKQVGATQWDFLKGVYNGTIKINK